MFTGFNISVGPNDTTVCKGRNATFNCGYFFIGVPANLVVLPQWIINGSAGRLSRESIDDDPDDLLQWIVDGDDTNTTRLLVGPVDESYFGKTTFQCIIPTQFPAQSRVATLTVIGKLPFNQLFACKLVHYSLLLLFLL